MDARKLVGMSQRRRKEMFHAEFEAARNKDGTVSMFVADALLSRWRIGQRLRPCPGCPSCTDSPRLQVIGYVRRIGGRVRIDRTLDVSGQFAFYVITFSWRHVGEMHKLRGFRSKQLAWEHMHEYLQSRGHLPGLCEGTGVLLARAKMREVRRCRQQGITKAEAWANMCNCLREHNELNVSCDGSGGVLPARAKKVRR